MKSIKKTIIISMFLLTLSYGSYAQKDFFEHNAGSLVYSNEKSNQNYPTPFDDFLLKHLGLTMNQYYNKMFSIIYESGFKNNPKYEFYTQFNNPKGFPLVIINDRRIQNISPWELYSNKFGKIRSVKHYQPGSKQAIAADQEYAGIIIFKTKIINPYL